jgi:hypothetical protein
MGGIEATNNVITIILILYLCIFDIIRYVQCIPIHYTYYITNMHLLLIVSEMIMIEKSATRTIL